MVFPTVQFIEFDKTVDPSGFRHISASGIKTLDTSTNGYLDFGNVNTTSSGTISATKMVVFRASNMADASGIYNLRFFLQNASAFNTGTYRFLYRVATHYQGSSFSLSLADLDTPTSEPSQNVLATNGLASISGITDNDVSQYIYLGVYVGKDVPYGTYGGFGAGSFRYRMVYDFS